MPLSWNEIKSRALAFSKDWQDEASEHAEAQSFWNDFFHIFGISRRRVASFEHSVKLLGQRRGHIGLFWKGVLLVEHKSLGKDLEKAFDQALDYFTGIAERDNLSDLADSYKQMLSGRLSKNQIDQNARQAPYF